MPDPLRELQETAGHLTRNLQARDQLIRAARKQGVPLRTIAEAAGVSYETVRRIAPWEPPKEEK
jgi:hypothetical protein